MLDALGLEVRCLTFYDFFNDFFFLYIYVPLYANIFVAIVPTTQFRGVSRGSNVVLFVIDANAFLFVCLFVRFLSLSQSLDQLIENTVPSSIRMHRSMKMDDPVCKLHDPARF